MSDPPPVGTTDELLEKVDSEWARLIRLLDGPGTRLTPPEWSAADILSHVRLYDAWLLGMFDPSSREEQAPYRSYLTTREDVDERNRLHVERDRVLTPEEVRRRALDAHAALRQRLASIPDEHLTATYSVTEDAFVPAADGRSLAVLIAIETFWHYRDHADTIEHRSDS
jgi:mycothiol maleylpyruvate isomerase-like protein